MPILCVTLYSLLLFDRFLLFTDVETFPEATDVCNHTRTTAGFYEILAATTKCCCFRFNISLI